MISHNALRAADRWVGGPLCAFASGLRHIAGLLAPQRIHQAPVRRALFVQLVESGSMVLADPAMRELARRSGAQLYCLTFASNRASLQLACTIPDAHVFTLRSHSAAVLLVDGWRFLCWARRQRIDTVIDLELFARLTAVLCYLTGVRRRVGFQRPSAETQGQTPVRLYRGSLYTHPVAFCQDAHIAQNYMSLVNSVLSGERTRRPEEFLLSASIPTLARRQIDVDEIVAVRQKLSAVLGASWHTTPPGSRGEQPLLLVNANASDMLPQRRWPRQHFVTLIAEFLDRFDDLQVLLIGAASDADTTRDIATQIANRRCIDIAGLLSIAELPALFSLSSALLSNDSGPAHFAAVTALPTVVLFGPETPMLFGPLNPHAVCLSANLPCSPCVNVSNQRRSNCADNRCMQAISVARVVDALAPLLASGRPMGPGVHAGSTMQVATAGSAT